VIGCVRNDDEAALVSVATTRDLDGWTIHDVGTAASTFGVVVGSDGEQTVTIAVLEADDPDTTMGAQLQLFTSDDLGTWQHRIGADDGVFTDGFAQRIRIFGDDVVVVGAVNDWSQGPDGPAARVPAVWVSASGAPFVRSVLPDPAGGEPSGTAFDIAATDVGFAAVGGDEGDALAWFSADLDSWDAADVADSGALASSDAGAMWSVATDGTNVVAGSVGHVGVATPTWSSPDGGRTWRPTDDGPSLVLRQGSAAVGVRSDEPAGLWRVELP
jgi:hypothetical protein